MSFHESKPRTLVLCKVSTGIGTVRSLAAAGFEVDAVIFNPHTPIAFSRLCRKIFLPHLEHDAPALVNWLIHFAQGTGVRLVLFPTSDEHALMLAQYQDLLKPYYFLWTTALSDFARVVDKCQLYQLAEEAKLPVIPMLIEPSMAAAEAWCREHSGPYLLKPAYEGAPTCNLRQKNLELATHTDLLNYLHRFGSQSLVVQRLIPGGDGYVFDCYGLCDTKGAIVTLASHRRLRQHPINLGATCYGEIPAGLPEGQEQLLFTQTSQLLQQIRYHGIFGIEWLLDKVSGQFYLLDFNARPFSTIGHLTDCGLNLPALAAAELTGTLVETTSTPQLEHVYWADVLRDIETMNVLRDKGQLSIWRWLLSILRCRSFAYWQLRDPLPGLYSVFKLVKRSTFFVGKKVIQPQRLKKCLLLLLLPLFFHSATAHSQHPTPFNLETSVERQKAE